jgi:hypothetical protein
MGYYDPTFGGVDLSPRWTEADQQIELATTLDQILGAIAQVPLSLGDSHTLLFPPAHQARHCDRRPNHGGSDAQ